MLFSVLPFFTLPDMPMKGNACWLCFIGFCSDSFSKEKNGFKNYYSSLQEKNDWLLNYHMSYLRKCCQRRKKNWNRKRQLRKQVYYRLHNSNNLSSFRSIFFQTNTIIRSWNDHKTVSILFLDHSNRDNSVKWRDPI